MRSCANFRHDAAMRRKFSAYGFSVSAAASWSYRLAILFASWIRRARSADKTSSRSSFAIVWEWLRKALPGDLEDAVDFDFE